MLATQATKHFFFSLRSQRYLMDATSHRLYQKDIEQYSVDGAGNKLMDTMQSYRESSLSSLKSNKKSQNGLSNLTSQPYTRARQFDHSLTRFSVRPIFVN